MKKTLIPLVVSLIMVVFVSSSFAQAGHLWKNKQLVKELGLSEKQVDKLKSVSLDTDRKMIKLRADTEMKELDLRELLDSDSPNEAKAVGLIKEIMRIKTDQKIMKVKQMILVKKTLTKEQMEKLEQKKRENRMKRKQKNPGKMGPNGDFKAGKGQRPNQPMKP